jgi:hypothetical protein
VRADTNDYRGTSKPQERIPWWRLTDEEREERRYQESLERRGLEDSAVLRNVWALKFTRPNPPSQPHLTNDITRIRGEHRAWIPVPNTVRTAA